MNKNDNMIEIKSVFPYPDPQLSIYRLQVSSIQLYCELCTLSVIITANAISVKQNLTKYKVIWTENLAERPSSYRVHRSWLKIHKNCPRHILTTYTQQPK